MVAERYDPRQRQDIRSHESLHYQSGAGCGGGDGGNAPSSSVASTPTADAAAAYDAYDSSFDVFDCSNAFKDLGDANVAHDFAAMKTHAAAYSSVLTKRADKMKAIEFPTSADDAVKSALAPNDAEIDHLRAVAGVSNGRRRQRGLQYRQPR
jgi:hypothetical protein